MQKVRGYQEFSRIISSHNAGELCGATFFSVVQDLAPRKADNERKLTEGCVGSGTIIGTSATKSTNCAD